MHASKVIKFFKLSVLYTFKELLENIKIIILDFKKVLFFILFIPICYFVIRVQIYIVLLFIFYYLVIFIVCLLLKTNYIIKCEELPAHNSKLIYYSIFNIFFAIPKAKSFITVYSFLQFLNTFKKAAIKKNIQSFEYFFAISCIFIFS